METFEVSPWRTTGILTTTDSPGSLGSVTLNLVSPNLITASKSVENTDKLSGWQRVVGVDVLPHFCFFPHGGWFIIVILSASLCRGQKEKLVSDTSILPGKRGAHRRHVLRGVSLSHRAYKRMPLRRGVEGETTGPGPGRHRPM